MTETVHSVQDRRAESQHLIKELVPHRSHMLGSFNELLSLRPFEDETGTAELLNRFCNAMIDYTADAHFRLYRYIEEGRERRNAVINVADRVYDAIVATTDTIVAFNDRYGVSLGQIPFQSLEADLSALGETLAERIEHEDQLISVFQQGRS